MAPALPLDEAVAEIEQLRARVEDVSTRNSRYSLISDSGSKPVMQKLRAPRAAGGAAAVDLLVEARDGAKKQQGLGDLTQLIGKGNSDIGVISVWGVGGDLGRTSIIRKAYQDPEICQIFGCRGWVKLTHPFNPHNFYQSMVAQFYTNSCLEQRTTVDVAKLKKMETMAMTHGGFVEEFMRQVNDKRYLLVLENVCTMGEWDAIRACLPDTKKGNWVIVSTEQREIATLCIGHPYQVLELKEYSSEYPVRVFFKEGSEGDEDKVVEADGVAAANDEISMDDGVNHSGVCLASKMDAAKSWLKSHTLFGRESQLNELFVTLGKACLQTFQVISVWGIAGAGKSSLIKTLYYNRILKESNRYFNKYAWVDLSHPFNLRDFSRSLLGELHSHSRQSVGINDPIQECRRLLNKHACLVVIDDLQSTEEWDSIQAALLSRSSKGIIILITTEARIAKHCAYNEEFVFSVKGLEATQAHHLFMEEVRRKNSLSALLSCHDKELEGVKNKLVSMCGGLPKVIAAITDFLAPKTVTAATSSKSLSKRFMHELESSPEFTRLRGLFGWMHSFFRTCPELLQPCIFYLSVFPGYQSIRRRRLVMRWVAEGYCRDTDSNTAEEEGEELFSELVDLSMIQPPPHTVITDMTTVSCHVSGFFHEYIITRPKEENVIFALEVFTLKESCRQTTRRTGRHLVIEESWDRDRIVFESIDFSRLRSLTVLGEWRRFFISKSMRVLRVLDLENASAVTDKDLEKMVKLLPRLKFLSVRGNGNICRLPSSLGDLRQLQTLDVRDTSIVALPASITKLKKLQYIRAGRKVPSTLCASVSCIINPCRARRLVGGVEAPKGTEKLTALHTLGVINVGVAWCKDNLKELKKLTQLRKLAVSGVSKKNSKDFCSAISGHAHLQSLTVWLEKDSKGCLDIMSGSMLSAIKSLKLRGLVKDLPEWIKKLPKLRKLDLEITISNDFNVVKGLMDLKELCILRLQVTPLRDVDGKLDFCVKFNALPRLCYEKVKILEIACSSKLDVNFGAETMPNLELLMVRCGEDTKFKFTELKDLAKEKLKEVRLIDSRDNTSLNEDMEKQLKEHPRKPTLRLEKSSSS